MNPVRITIQSSFSTGSSEVGILESWDLSITAGLIRASHQIRNSRSNVPIFDASGNETNMPAGDQLVRQQQIISKVLGVLQ